MTVSSVYEDTRRKRTPFCVTIREGRIIQYYHFALRSDALAFRGEFV